MTSRETYSARGIRKLPPLCQRPRGNPVFGWPIVMLLISGIFWGPYLFADPLRDHRRHSLSRLCILDGCGRGAVAFCTGAADPQSAKTRMAACPRLSGVGLNFLRASPILFLPWLRRRCPPVY